MSQPPRTYAAWAELLTQCAQGDDAALDPMSDGQWTPDAGTATRFATLLNATYTARKQRWLTDFSRSQAVGPALRSATDFALFLRRATANLRPLYRLVGLAALPSDVRTTLQDDLAKFVQDVSNTLRDNAVKNGGNRREELLFALRGFGTPSAATAAHSIAAETVPTKGGRRIIF